VIVAICFSQHHNNAENRLEIKQQEPW